MTHRPPQPLDAEERALAAQLPRLHGRSEPTAELDARILAAAHAAAQQPAKPTRRRWAAPLALAASLCLAVGVAWRVQLTPSQPASETPSPHNTAPRAAAEVAKLEAPATDSASNAATIAPPNTPTPAPRPAPIRAPSVADTPPSPQRVLAPPPPEDAPVVLESPRAFAQEAAPAPPPPPAPAPPAAAPMSAPMSAAADTAPAAASGALATPSAHRPEAAMGKAVQMQRQRDFANTDAPLDDVPPATMASPAARDAWLKRIRQLHQQGDLDAARASLAEFRRRYPQATLPPDLRDLERPQEQSNADPAAH